jgi:hypothetical protein
MLLCNVKHFIIMEGNYITSGDLAMWDTARTSRAGNYYGEGCGYGNHRNHGTATTGVALGAAGLGIAVFGGLAIAYGLNAASKSRLRAAEAAAAGNAKAIDILAQSTLAERQSRESWQNNHAPTMTQYVDVRTGAGAFSGAGANAAADALALSAIAGNNNGSRSGQVCPQPVALYQPAMPCRCNTCGD